MPFGWIERVFGYCGLASCLRGRRDQAAADGARSREVRPSGAAATSKVYLYFVVGLIGAAMVPYEVYFYSSGAVEERWEPKELGAQRRERRSSATRSADPLLRADDLRGRPASAARHHPRQLLGTLRTWLRLGLDRSGWLALVESSSRCGEVETSSSGAYNRVQLSAGSGASMKIDGAAHRPGSGCASPRIDVMTRIDRSFSPEFSLIFSVVTTSAKVRSRLCSSRTTGRTWGVTRTAASANIFGIYYFVVMLLIAVCGHTADVALEQHGPGMTKTTAHRSRARAARPSARRQREPPVRQGRRPRDRGHRRRPSASGGDHRRPARVARQRPYRPTRLPPDARSGNNGARERGRGGRLRRRVAQAGRPAAARPRRRPRRALRREGAASGPMRLSELLGHPGLHCIGSPGQARRTSRDSSTTSRSPGSSSASSQCSTERMAAHESCGSVPGT